VGLAQELPEFAAVIRGYDRAQVDDFILRLYGSIEEAEERTCAAEQEILALKQEISWLEERASSPTPRSLTEFANRVSQVLEVAVAAAQELRDETEREAEGIRSAAMADRKNLLMKAQSEAQHIIDGAHSEGHALRQEHHNLTVARDAALADLGELQARLAELVHAPHAASGKAIDQLVETKTNDKEVSQLFDQETQSTSPTFRG
jgi:cell division septum initiation protein DivIVA